MTVDVIYKESSEKLYYATKTSSKASYRSNLSTEQKQQISRY